MEKCIYCGEEATTKDHIIPRSWGGSNDKSNLVPACKLCNTTRGDLAQEAFIQFLVFMKAEGKVLKELSRNQRKMMKYRFLRETGIEIGPSFSRRIFEKEPNNLILPREERLKALENLRQEQQK